MALAVGFSLALLSAALRVVTGCSSIVAILAGFLLCFISSLDVLKLQRKWEGIVGGYLIKLGSKKLLKKAQLVEKSITLKESGLTVHYVERLPAKTTNKTPTLLLCHGITSESKNLALLVSTLAEELPNWRMICPDTLGHGKDLERVKKEGHNFKYPTPLEMGEAVRNMLLELGITECYAYGASLGGALVYFLQDKHPELIKKSVLICPAVEAVIQQSFIDDWEQGRKNHFCWESRDDLYEFMIDLSCPQRQVKHPIPTFLLQAMWEKRQNEIHKQHFRNFLDHLLNLRGSDPDWLSCKQDNSPELPRLVMWPEEDFIAGHDKGKAFFANSPNTQFISIPDCGHMFHSDGKTILVKGAPYMIDYFKEAEAAEQ